MKLEMSKCVVAIVSVLTFGSPGFVSASSETTDANNILIYNNRAYAPETGSTSIPDAALKVENAEIVYVNNAYGPAIYSYVGQVSPVSTAFNVEFVDTAYGQAIYSYPNNNPKHFLELSEAADITDRDIIPAALTAPAGAGWKGELTVNP